MKQARLLLVCLLILASMCMVLSSDDAQATVNPGYNGKIAFSSNRDGNSEIYLMNADGSNPQRVTNGSSFDSSVIWSPDGTKAAFGGGVASCGGTGNSSEVCIFNTDGSGLVNITNAIGWDGSPEWSPDGSKIVFQTSRDGNYEIYSMNADGSGVMRLTNDIALDGWSQWSPDGSKIVFQRGSVGSENIYTMNADGSNQVEIVNNIASDNGPRWSPDGSKITFTSKRDGNSEIYMMNADGSGQTRLTNDGDADLYQQWSPDGSKMAFLRYNDAFEASKLVIYDFTGSTEQEYDLSSDGLLIVDDVRWSPDGKKLLLTGYHENTWTTWDQYVMDVDNENITQLTNDGSSGYGVWQSIPNTSPTAVVDSFSVSFNTPSLIEVLANDTDEEALSGSNLTILVQPTHGSAAIEASKVKYTPINGYQGPDSLTYQICDSFVMDQMCSTGTLNLAVLAPTAPSLTVTNVNGEHFSPQTNQYITSNLRPTFSGTATPGSEITIEIHSDPIILTTIADGNGNWSVTSTFDLPSGQHMVYISATLNGLTTNVGAFGLIIGSLASTGTSLWVMAFVCVNMLLGGIALLIQTARSKLSTAQPVRE